MASGLLERSAKPLYNQICPSIRPGCSYCGANARERIAIRVLEILILRRCRNLHRGRSQVASAMSLSAVLSARNTIRKKLPDRLARSLHTSCAGTRRRSTRTRPRTSRFAPRRNERQTLARLASVSAARHGTPPPSPTPHLTCGRGAMSKLGELFTAMPTGGQNAQELRESSPQHSELLRHLRRKVRAYPLLLLANCALLQEVRR
jgi:hypothetical protein